MKVAAIVAMSKNRVIGRAGKLPWRIPEDMQRFKELTMGGTVLMGRNTFESLPDRVRPLPGRRNVVVTNHPQRMFGYHVEVSSSPLGALKKLAAEGKDEIVWVIGGAQIYAATIDRWDEVYLTLVDGDHDGDVYFPEFEEDFVLVDSEPHEGFTFYRYERIKEAA